MSESLYILEEYIPLKVLISKDEEILDYLTYKKGSKSFLELSFGIHSGMIKRILLLSCKEYEYIDDEILIDKYDEFDLIFTHDNIECKIFKTILYRNGVKIYLSDNRVNRYVRLDSIYFGLSDDNLIVEICICEMNAYELNHLKNELKQAT